jgi:ParB-like chromosome segregation protein Spo0J
MLRFMKLEEIPLTGIDFENESFRISEDLEVPRLDASLRAIGQVNAVVLMEGPPAAGFRIVCGFRRLHALRRLERSSASARLLNTAGLGMRDILLRAVWDNLSHRELGPLEAARILFTLKHVCEVEDHVLVERFLPLLNLKPHRNVLLCYLRLHSLHPEVRRLLNVGHMTLSSAERLAQYSRDEQAAVGAVWCRVGLSASLQRKVLDLVKDLAMIAGGSVAAVLGRNEILDIVEDARLSAFQKGEKVHEWLFRQKNPRLSAARDAFLTEKEKLQLPGTVRLSPDAFFETPRIRVEFEVSSPQAFRDAVAALSRSSRESALDRLFLAS